MFNQLFSDKSKTPNSKIIDFVKKKTGFQLHKRLGEGGYACVYSATRSGDIRKKKYALRFVRSVGRDSAVLDKELRTLKMIVELIEDWHPNLCNLHECHLFDKNHDRVEFPDLGDKLPKEFLDQLTVVVMVMELCDDALKNRLSESKENKIPIDELMSYMEQAAAAIDFLNDLGIQHRDIKPGNILLLGDSIKVADFGLLSQQTCESATATSMSGAKSFGYSAPELDRNKGTEKSSDQYSLGITYLELRTGKLPYTNPNNIPSIILAKSQESLLLDGLSAYEKKVVLKATKNDPSKRYKSCTEFVENLKTAVNKTSKPQRASKPKSKNVRFGSFRLVKEEASVEPDIQAFQAESPKIARAIMTIVPTDSKKLIPTDRSSLAVALRIANKNKHWAQIYDYFYLNGKKKVMPNREQIEDSGETPPFVAIASEFIAQDVRDCHQEDQLELFAKAASTLDSLHQQGFLHGNVRPSHLKRRKNGEFAMAGIRSMRKLDSSLGQKMKAFAPHLPPEAKTGKLGKQADQYMLAVSYVETVSGKSVSTDCTLRHLIDTTGMSTEIREVLETATHADPDQRFGSCVEFVSSLAGSQVRVGSSDRTIDNGDYRDPTTTVADESTVDTGKSQTSDTGSGHRRKTSIGGTLIEGEVDPISPEDSNRKTWLLFTIALIGLLVVLFFAYKKGSDWYADSFRERFRNELFEGDSVPASFQRIDDLQSRFVDESLKEEWKSELAERWFGNEFSTLDELQGFSATPPNRIADKEAIDQHQKTLSTLVANWRLAKTWHSEIHDDQREVWRNKIRSRLARILEAVGESDSSLNDVEDFPSQSVARINEKLNDILKPRTLPAKHTPIPTPPAEVQDKTKIEFARLLEQMKDHRTSLDSVFIESLHEIIGLSQKTEEVKLDEFYALMGQVKIDQISKGQEILDELKKTSESKTPDSDMSKLVTQFSEQIDNLREKTVADRKKRLTAELRELQINAEFEQMRQLCESHRDNFKNDPFWIACRIEAEAKGNTSFQEIETGDLKKLEAAADATAYVPFVVAVLNSSKRDPTPFLNWHSIDLKDLSPDELKWWKNRRSNWIRHAEDRMKQLWKREPRDFTDQPFEDEDAYPFYRWAEFLKSEAPKTGAMFRQAYLMSKLQSVALQDDDMQRFVELSEELDGANVRERVFLYRAARALEKYDQKDDHIKSAIDIRSKLAQAALNEKLTNWDYQRDKAFIYKVMNEVVRPGLEDCIELSKQRGRLSSLKADGELARELWKINLTKISQPETSTNAARLLFLEGRRLQIYEPARVTDVFACFDLACRHDNTDGRLLVARAFARDHSELWMSKLAAAQADDASRFERVIGPTPTRINRLQNSLLYGFATRAKAIYYEISGDGLEKAMSKFKDSIESGSPIPPFGEQDQIRSDLDLARANLRLLHTQARCGRASELSQLSVPSYRPNDVASYDEYSMDLLKLIRFQIAIRSTMALPTTEANKSSKEASFERAVKTYGHLRNSNFPQIRTEANLVLVTAFLYLNDRPSWVRISADLSDSATDHALSRFVIGQFHAQKGEKDRADDFFNMSFEYEDLPPGERRMLTRLVTQIRKKNENRNNSVGND